MDLALPNVLGQPTVAFHLLPLAGATAKAAPTKEKPSGTKKRSRSPARQSKAGTKGGAKGKKGKQRGPNIPAGLINKALETPQKQRICWGFNLPNGCKAAKPGESCSKGLHVCAEPGCFKPHSLQERRWEKGSFTTGQSADGRQISQVFALEVFAGTARLTASLRTLGLVDSIGIDCIMPSRLNGPILKLDLLNPDHLSFVKDLIKNDACVYVHFAPPCGTASRARLIQDRDKPMPPPPLRNDFYPNGLPLLTKEQQERVGKANELYRITCELILLCQSRSILWSCENPGRSFMWQTKPFVELFSKIQCMSTDFHHCMFGSARRKLTKLIHNIHYLHQLHKLCDNQHEHEPWGQKADGSWATSEETAYPWPLARAIAAQVVLQLQSQGIVCHLPSFAEQEATLQAMRASTNIQPRRHLPSFVPEFKEVVHKDCCAPLPSNARVLSTPKRGMSRVPRKLKKDKNKSQ